MLPPVFMGFSHPRQRCVGSAGTWNLDKPVLQGSPPSRLCRRDTAHPPSLAVNSLPTVWCDFRIPWLSDVMLTFSAESC